MLSPAPAPAPITIDTTTPSQGVDSSQIPAPEAVVVAISDEAMHALSEREAERAPATVSEKIVEVEEEETEAAEAAPEQERVELAPGRTPEETIIKAERALRETRAMRDPSPGDLWTAARASAMEISARAELAATPPGEAAPDPEAMQRRVEDVYAA